MARNRDYYSAANPRETLPHPVDLAVERRLRHRVLRKRILKAMEQILAALGKDRNLFLDLEALLGDRSIDREQAFLNAGFERGLIEGRATARASSIRARRNPKRAALVSELVRAALDARLPPPGAVPALLETAWSLALSPGWEGKRIARGRREAK